MIVPKCQKGCDVLKAVECRSQTRLHTHTINVRKAESITICLLAIEIPIAVQVSWKSGVWKIAEEKTEYCTLVNRE